MSEQGQLEFVRPSPDLEVALAAFFEHLRSTGEEGRFHPHPLSPEAARERVRYGGPDLYCLAVARGQVLGYGMLRGWEEGYAIPSLGIAIHASARGTGLGRAMMLYLHAEARRRGAARIRLKVHPDNQPAIALYKSLGYQFQPEMEKGQLVGLFELSGGST